MEQLEEYKISELRALAKQLNLDIKSVRKSDFIEAITKHYETAPPREQAVETTKVVLFFPGAIYSPGLGRYDKGYHLFEKEQADKWLAVSRRVRVADPKEVAAYYGV